jgi:mannose-1-phosphate guanylyltransferase
MHSQGGIRAMVLAAGVGSRLDPLTQQLPKPLVPLANRPVMEHILNLLKRHGIRDVVSNVHYLGEKIPQYFGTGASLDMNLSFLHEQKLSGDAGGVRACRQFLEGDTFIVLMGDLITDMDLTYVIQQHKEKGALATIALKQVEDVERFGVAVTNKDGFISGFQEKPAREEAASNLASTGVYVFEPQIFEHIAKQGDAFFGKQLFPQLVANGLPVLGVQVWAYWSDVGTIPQYRTSTFDALEGLIDLEMPGEKTKFGWMGEESSLDPSATIDGALLLGRNSHVGAGVRLKGHVVIGDNCVIERDCDIKDSIIWSGTLVDANSRMKHTVIGANCFVENGSRLIEAALVEPENPFGQERMPNVAASRRPFSVTISSVDLPAEQATSVLDKEASA